MPLVRHDPAEIRSLLTPVRARRAEGACSMGCGNFPNACLARGTPRETPWACHNTQLLWTLPVPSPKWEPLDGAADLRGALSVWKQTWDRRDGSHTTSVSLRVRLNHHQHRQGCLWSGWEVSSAAFPQHMCYSGFPTAASAMAWWASRSCPWGSKAPPSPIVCLDITFRVSPPLFKFSSQDSDPGSGNVTITAYSVRWCPLAALYRPLWILSLASNLNIIRSWK